MIDVMRFAALGLDTPHMRAVRACIEANPAALPSAIPPGPFIPPAQVDRTPDLIAAVLAAGMMAASGREHTAEEAVGVFRGVRDALSASACS